MPGLVWILEAILLGCGLICRFADLPKVQPLWARIAIILGAGAAGGIGLSACIFFLFGILIESAPAAMLVELAVLLWTGYELFRRRIPLFAPAANAPHGVLFPLAAASLLFVLGLATVAMWGGWEANPNGDWDAWAIWNLRGRFIASGDGLAHRAWSPVLGTVAHPEYPLLLSSAIGRCWAFSRTFDTAVSAAASYTFFLALIALAAGGIAAVRGPTLGLWAALTLAATPSLLHEVPAQYADVPLACYIAAALVFAVAERPILAGIFAGCAAWTKDEGLLFLVVFLAAMAVFKRRAALAAALGALPAAALDVFFKAFLARGNASLLSTSLPGAGHRIANVSRYGTVIAAFGRGLAGMGAGWYHPIFPLLVLAAVLRFDRERRREAAFCGSIAGALLLGYFAMFIVTSNDLAWQLQTSLPRLLIQVWPALVVTVFVSLRVPESTAIAIAKPAPKAQKKARRGATR